MNAKTKHLKICLLFLAAILCAPTIAAQSVVPVTIHWHNEATDTVRINKLLSDASALPGKTTQSRVAAIAAMFVETPYRAATLEIEPEGLVVNLDSLDCTTLVETVAALALTVGEGRTAWQDFLHNLTSLRYRGGDVDGYASRLHYISEWILDNEHRGNLRDVTDRFPATATQTKTLDYMTTHRDAYPALSDQATFEQVKNTEIGFRNHRIPYVKAGATGSKPVISQLRDGDIVALVCRTPGLDVSHLGIISMDADGIPHLLHASLRQGKVVVDSQPLSEYMRKNRNLLGLRIVRLSDR